MHTIEKSNDGHGRLQFDTIAFSGVNKNDGSVIMQPARYARGMVLVRVSSTGLFMGRAGRLAAAISRRRYTNRERGYVMTPSQANKMQRLFMDGFDANGFTDTIVAPRT